MLKGSVEINVEGKVQFCTPGTLVHLPAGTVHGYRFGAGGGEMFEMTGSGSTATQMFTDVDREVPPGPPDLARLMPVFEHHGVTLAMGEAA